MTMSGSIHKFLMALGAFSTTYTISKIIVAVSSMPHIGTIILIFIASVIAFFSKETIGRFISTIYLVSTAIVSYFVEIYHALGVMKFSLPWPYRGSSSIDNNDAMLTVFQKSEASFILLVLICIFSVYYYMRKIKSIHNSNTINITM